MAEAKSKNTTPTTPSKTAAAPSKRATTKAKPLATPKKVSAAKPTAKKSAAPRKTAAKSAAPKKTRPGPEAVYRMIQDAAYFIAERNGFAGDSKVYWAQAEVQITRLLK